MLIPFTFFKFIPINGVIHIGAHEAEELIPYIRKGIYKVLWIEANPEKYIFLRNKLLDFPKMILGEFAAGEKEDFLELNIANNSQASSILELGTHKKSYPSITYTSKAKVPVKPVDNWMDSLQINKSEFNFLNLDIQGYELRALKGLKKQLKFIDYIYTEVSVCELYVGVNKLNEIDSFLSSHGFKRVATKLTKDGWGDVFYTKSNVTIMKIYFWIVSFIMLGNTKLYKKIRYEFGILRRKIKKSIFE